MSNYDLFYGKNKLSVDDLVLTPSSSTDTKAKESKEVTNKTKDITEEYIEGVISVIPNSDYRARTAFKVSGVGKLFEGTHYLRKVTHTINNDGYSVEAETLKMGNKSVLSSDERVNKAPKVPSKPKYKYITIVWGDTLWALSRKYGTTVSHLAKINNIRNPDLIYAGNKLKVPAR